MAPKVSQSSPTTVGDYELLEKIADGGMGSVFRARHRVTGQMVAVKTVAPFVAADPVLSRRVEQEFRAARSLDHPHIIRSLDLGMDGLAPYLVMELVEGESLGDRIERAGPLPEAQAVAIILQIAEALHTLHQRNTIHRDIKPDNIMLTANNVAKLADFGLVKFVDAETALTQNAGALGTPNFMAPEQFADSSTVDARADIYSLGATLYMAVTGELPFRTRDHRKYMQILKKKLNNDIPAPRQLVPTLSEQVDLAIRRSLRASRKQRQRDCPEFIATLTGDTVHRDEREQPSIRTHTIERRAAVRQSSDLQGVCQPMARTREVTWAATIRDISVVGMGLLLPRRFEPGTLLTVEMTSKDGRTRRYLLARVIRVERRAKAWETGCTFLHALGHDELRELL